MTGRKLRFGTFEADLATGELRRNGIRVRLADQPFRVLAILLMRAGEVVTREELQEQIWPEDVFVDFDQGLNKAINKIREALSDLASSPRFLETIPRRGYRFIAPVTEIEVVAEESVRPFLQDPANSEGSRVEPRGQAALMAAQAPLPPAHVVTPRALALKRRQRVALAAGLLLCVVLAGSIRWFFTSRPGEHKAIDSLAVLPMTLSGGDADLQYLGDGIAENIINTVSQLPRVRVMAQTTVAHYREQDHDPRAVGQDLHVRAVVSGRMVRVGDKVEVSLEMTDVEDGSHLWGARFQTPVGDTQAVQTEMATAIANQLVKLNPGLNYSPNSNSTADPEAYRLYMLGRFYWNKRTPEALAKASDYFEQAIQHDLNFGQAYAGVADAYAQRSWDSAPPLELMPRAKAMATRALELKEQNAEAHTSMAMIKALYDWDFPGAEREFQRAIQLNPGYATAHHWYGVHLAAMGRFDESRVELTRARELDPLSLVINTNYAYPDFYNHHLAEAVRVFQHTAEMDTHFALVHEDLLTAYERTGDDPNAVREAVQLLELRGETDLAQKVAAAARTGGLHAGLQVWLDALLGQSKTGYVAPMAVADLYIQLGERDKAFEWLNKAVAARAAQLVYLRVEPRYDSLRTDPRFASLLSAVGLH